MRSSNKRERSHVDNEAIAHAAALHALERLIDLVDRDRSCHRQDLHPDCRKSACFSGNRAAKRRLAPWRSRPRRILEVTRRRARPWRFTGVDSLRPTPRHSARTGLRAALEAPTTASAPSLDSIQNNP
jgi:hypothetical protein